MKRVAIAEKCLAVYPWMKFGYCFVKNLSWGEASDALSDKQKKTEDFIRNNSQALNPEYSERWLNSLRKAGMK